LRSFFMCGVFITCAALPAFADDARDARSYLKSNLANSIENAAEQAIRSRVPNVEVEISGFKDGKPQYGIIAVQPLSDNLQAGRATFLQLSAFAQNDRETLNLGIGQRFLHNGGKVITGLNVFFDHELDYEHQRWSIGGEILTSVGDVRVNFYEAISDEEVGKDNALEQALGGFDAELALPLPYMPTTRIHAKTFSWEGENGADDFEGETVSLRSEMPYGFTLEAGQTSYDSDNVEDKDFITLTWNFAMTNRAMRQPFISKRAYMLADISNRRFEKVRRENRIIKQVSSSELTITVSGF